MTKIALGRPAQIDDYIIKRRIEILHTFDGFVDSSKSLVDIGCGNGGTLLNIHSKFKTLHGIDIVEENLNLLQNYCREMGIDNCSSELLNMDESPVKNQTFDRAISFEVLEHVQDEHATLQNIHASLNTDSLFAMSIPNKWWIFETHGAHLPVLPWNRVPFFSWLPKCIHSRFAKARIYTRKQIINLLESNGFVVEKTFYITAPMDVITWKPLQTLLRKTIFKNNTTSIPFLSTAIMVFARKK